MLDIEVAPMLQFDFASPSRAEAQKAIRLIAAIDQNAFGSGLESQRIRGSRAIRSLGLVFGDVYTPCASGAAEGH